MTSAPKLTPNHLDQLDAALSAQGAPVVDRWRPGLSDEQIDLATAPLGVKLPAEPRLLWSWHDGADLLESDENGLDLISAGPGNCLAPLHEAVSESTRWREWALETEPDDPDSRWQKSWLPFIGEYSVIDCSGDTGAVSPIRNTHPFSEPEDYGGIVLPSLGALVLLWIEALETGLWEWDPSENKGAWQLHQDRESPTTRALRAF